MLVGQQAGLHHWPTKQNKYLLPQTENSAYPQIENSWVYSTQLTSTAYSLRATLFSKLWISKEEELKTLPLPQTQVSSPVDVIYLHLDQINWVNLSKWGTLHPLLFNWLCQGYPRLPPDPQRGVPATVMWCVSSFQGQHKILFAHGVMKCLCCFLLKHQIQSLWEEVTPHIYISSGLNIFNLFVFTFSVTCME